MNQDDRNETDGRPDASAPDAVEIIIEPRARDLGGFTVGRILPFAKRRMVGPFVFLDEIGPSAFAPGEAVDVRPHPHIGLSTLTYLFEGELRHRDSLGFDQVIRPGAVNWMTAGRGIVHSERTDAGPRASGQTLHGLQAWIALPDGLEDIDPAFEHFGENALPAIDADGVTARLIAGGAFGRRAPTTVHSDLFYVAATAADGARIPLPEGHAERALYVVEGAVRIDGARHEKRRLIVFREGAAPHIAAAGPARVMLLGGDPVGERTIWWNLVAGDPARIEAAIADWAEAAAQGFPDGRFTLPAGENEYIPLPEK